MEKRTFAAVIISILILFGWQYFFAPKHPQKHLQDVQASSHTSVAAPVAVSSSAAVVLPSGSRTHDKARVVNIETDSAIYELSEQDAGITACYLKEKDTGRKEVNLVLPGSKFLEDAGTGVWEFVGKDAHSAKFVTSAGDLDIEKTFIFRDGAYLADVEYLITNSGNEQRNFSGLNISAGPGIGTDAIDAKENKRLTRAVSYTVKKADKLKPGEYSFPGKWVGLDNRYFLFAIFRDGTDFNNIHVSERDKLPVLRITTGQTLLNAGSTKKIHLSAYIGPKGYTRLKGIKLDGFEPELEKAVDFGFFNDVGKLALLTLNYFYKLTSNYGWSIVLISIILNIVFFPLSKKSFQSAQAMKSIQGEVKLLQVKYKSDPKKMNTEVWNLYKSKGVNPFSGCFPMLIQLPIFWALFTMLRNAYELRGAPWIFWINDLSRPDVLFTISGFGVPVLPIIMGLGMFVQQWMTTSSADPTQKQLMFLMPIIFTIMFISFPSGLVLYWLTNSTITIVEQYFMMKKIAVK
ncbi:MAG: Membrane protein insertase YidC [Elusimicrobia bacterium ADurb.Bin231]|nr:MAG: Membrane protein insertase YidC [Elusimicrobia bacterium ADurb.Bin231]